MIWACRHWTRLASALAISVFVLVSCSFGPPPPPTPATPSSDTTPSATATSITNSSSTPAGTSSPPLDVNLAAAFASVYSRTGESHCPNWFDHWDNVVLTQSKLTYSADEISKMASAVTAARLDYSKLDPSLLAVQPGVVTSAPPGLQSGLMATFRTSSACMFSVGITNKGQSPIQIPQAGLRLTASPTTNSAAYRLVEFCSVLHSTTYCGPQAGGPPPGCSVYGVEVALTNQPSGADIMSTPQQVDQTGRPCPQVTLSPGRSVTFVMGAYSADPLIYRAIPVLRVITPKGQGTVPLPLLGAAYSFARASQFTCYRLSASTFVVWQKGAAAYDFLANQNLGAWCP